jgi:transcriptional regulator with AAA-type ATPase domain
MPTPSYRDLAAANAIAELGYCNPFKPERIQLEREVLQEAFIWTDDAWHRRVDTSGAPPNIDLMTDRSHDLAELMRAWLIEESSISSANVQVYEDMVLYLLYYEHHSSFHKLIIDALSPDDTSAAPRRAPFYKAFVNDLEHYLKIPGYTFTSLEDSAHLFACLFQLRRAFHFIYDNIIGGSMAAARFRASVWESIFTHDVRRYRRSLFRQMGDIATLIVGPSGTGKELVAQAIGRACYIPFNPKSMEFEEDFSGSMYALNLAALSPTLIESELFGHRKGAFTGAIEDRNGWFGMCPTLGTVFLDEIGEIDQSIQVKLLRVLQTRTFQPIGGTDSQSFKGKIIAATNRDLAGDIEEGRFRADLYYRLCSDLIVTPTLHDQVRESPDQLHNLLLFVCRSVGGEEEAEALANESERWILDNLGVDYSWPGNIRELEQCVRNLLIRKSYVPPQSPPSNAPDRLAQAVRDGRLTADELQTHYFTLVYSQTGNYQETGRRLGVDGRTAKSRVDQELLREYKENL